MVFGGIAKNRSENPTHVGRDVYLRVEDFGLHSVVSRRDPPFRMSCCSIGVFYLVETWYFGTDLLCERKHIAVTGIY